jgi:hypothetical protein
MTRGRPNISEQVVLDYLTGKPDRTLDRQLDGPAIRGLAEQRGLPRFDLPVKRPIALGLGSVRFVTVAERKVLRAHARGGFRVAGVDGHGRESSDRLLRLAASLPVVANALRNVRRDGSLDPERLVADALRFNSPI